MTTATEPGLAEQVTILDGNVLMRMTTGWVPWAPDQRRWDTFRVVEWEAVLAAGPRLTTDEDRIRLGLPLNSTAATAEELAVAAFCAYDGQDPTRVTPADLGEETLTKWMRVVHAVRSTPAGA